MRPNHIAAAVFSVACCGMIGCVDRVATRELRVIEPRMNNTTAFAVDYSAVPEQYIRRVEEVGEKGQPITVIYLQTPVKVTVVPLSD